MRFNFYVILIQTKDIVSELMKLIMVMYFILISDVYSFIIVIFMLLKRNVALIVFSSIKG